MNEATARSLNYDTLAMTTATSMMPRCCAGRAMPRSPTMGYDQILPHVMDVALVWQATFVRLCFESIALPFATAISHELPPRQPT